MIVYREDNLILKYSIFGRMTLINRATHRQIKATPTVRDYCKRVYKILHHRGIADLTKKRTRFAYWQHVAGAIAADYRDPGMSELMLSDPLIGVIAIEERLADPNF